MFNPIVFLRAAREGELLDTIHIVRRVETHGLSLLGVAVLIGPIVGRVHSLFAEDIIAGYWVIGVNTLLGQNGTASESSLGAVALVSNLHAKFLAFCTQFIGLMVHNFWSLSTDSETLLVKLVDGATYHAVIAAKVLARFCVLLRVLRYDMVAGVRCSEAADTKALVHGGCATACSVCPHLLLYFFGYETNLFDIAVYLLAALKHRLIRRASRDTSGAAVASVSRLPIYLNRPVWVHL